MKALEEHKARVTLMLVTEYGKTYQQAVTLVKQCSDIVSKGQADKKSSQHTAKQLIESVVKS